MSLLDLFKPPCTIEIRFDDEAHRSTVELQRENGGKEQYFLFIGNEPVKGTVSITTQPGKKIEHKGIKVELIGQIELFYDRGNHYEFLSLVQDLAPPGELENSVTYPFEFLNCEKNSDSYNGINVRLRYFMRVSCFRSGLSSNMIQEFDFWVSNYTVQPELNNPIKMEVGIEDCLHIEFEYNRSKYHLKDAIIGKIFFLLVRIKIKHMELCLIKRESTGTGPNSYNEVETLAKLEIMDGAPVKGESIPVRMFLGGYELTPTYQRVGNKFSVKYFLNLILIDEDDRRYFKQQEIFLWRKKPKTKKEKSKGGVNGGVSGGVGGHANVTPQSAKNFSSEQTTNPSQDSTTETKQ